MWQGFAWSAMTFGIARFGLGLGESGNFPAAIKTAAEWFPKRERAFAYRHLQFRHEHRRRHRPLTSRGSR